MTPAVFTDSCGCQGKLRITVLVTFSSTLISPTSKEFPIFSTKPCILFKEIKIPKTCTNLDTLLCSIPNCLLVIQIKIQRFCADASNLIRKHLNFSVWWSNISCEVYYVSYTLESLIMKINAPGPGYFNCYHTYIVDAKVKNQNVQNNLSQGTRSLRAKTCP